MDKTLLDTDIYSEILKAKNARVLQRAAEYRKTFARYTISVVTVMEIVTGFHKVQREDRIQQFLGGLATVELLGFDMVSATLAGRIYADLQRNGQMIGRADPMIASIAISNGLTLATGNMAHYQRIQALGYALRLDDWRQ